MQELHEWFMDIIDQDKNKDTLIFKKTSESQVMWVRDNLIGALWNTPAWIRPEKDPDLNWSENYAKEKAARPTVSVIGEHRSKSTILPVYYMKFCGVELVMRNNFHDWNVSVVSPFPIEGLITEIFPFDTDYCYYQGFPDEYKFKAYSETNKQKFSFHLGRSNETLWTFVWLLGQMIKERGNK